MDAIPALIDGALTFLLAIVDAIPLLIDALVPQVPTIVSTIIDGLLACLPQLVDGAVKLLFGILKAIPQIQATLVKEVPRIVGTIVTGLLGAIPELFKAGGQLLEGLVDGMMDFDIMGAVWSIGSAIINGFKGVFDIHSPSRVMAELGEMLDAGLAVGVTDNAKAPVKAMEGLSDDMLDAAGRLNGLAIERSVAHTFAAPEATYVDNLNTVGTLEKILEAIKRGQVLALDGKKIVGATASMTDSALGQRRALVARGAM